MSSCRRPVGSSSSPSPPATAGGASAPASWTRWRGRCESRGVASCVALNCGTNRLPLGLDVRYTAAPASSGSGGTSAPAPPRTWWLTSPPRTRPTCRPAQTRRACWRAAWPSGECPPLRLWVEEGVRGTGRVCAQPALGLPGGPRLPHRSPSIEVAYAQDTGAFLGSPPTTSPAPGRWAPLGYPGRATGWRRLRAVKRCLRDLRGPATSEGSLRRRPHPLLRQGGGGADGRVYYQYARSLSGPRVAWGSPSAPTVAQPTITQNERHASRETRGRAQNIYDDPRFFAGYATLERFGAGWSGHGAARFRGLLRGLGGRRRWTSAAGRGSWPCTWPTPRIRGGWN